MLECTWTEIIDWILSMQQKVLMWKLCKNAIFPESVTAIKINNPGATKFQESVL
jgi:hypothetical protein